MSFDTKYRPIKFDDVLGQDATVKILRRFVATGTALRQSYLFAGRYGSGKCVIGETLVTTDRGISRIDELVQGPGQVSPLSVKVLQENGSVADSAYGYLGGIRDTIRIKTDLGLSLEGTPNHRIRVMSSEGVIVWRALGDIQPGDYACIVRKGGFFGSGAGISAFSSEDPGDSKYHPNIPAWDPPKSLTPEWGRLLGYAIGDGCCVAQGSLGISSAEADTTADILNLFQTLCGSGGITPDKRSGAGLVNVRMCRKRVRAFMAFLGLGHVKAKDKEVPWAILRSPESVVREFLAGYFEADGGVGLGGIEVTTKSEKLANQVQLLLLQFGVVSRKSSKIVGKYGVFWRLCIRGFSVKAFADRVGFRSQRKSRILQEYLEQNHAQGQKRSLTNRWDAIPFQCNLVREFYRALPSKVRTRSLGEIFQCQKGRPSFTYNALKQLVALGVQNALSKHFQELLDADYYYDRVVGVSQGRADVFDLNVPDGEMFAANGFMNHNTTLARILARAILCEHPTPEGDPCDECSSCRSLIESGTSFDFVEVDAATNSGKDDIKKITEEIQYSSFTGRRRIYLLDESHRLSASALDALLKPLEEDIPGTNDKRLVCIFCTTEPESMRATIFSRCAPIFVIQPVSPEDVAKRLAYVCQQEGIPYEEEMLRVISETTECHIRDALKAVEGVALLGGITRDNVTSYLHLDLNNSYLDLLGAIGKDLSGALQIVKQLLDRVSPATIYEKLSEICVLAFQVHIGALNPPVFWDKERLKAVGAVHSEALLAMAERFANRPGRPTASMLSCDVACLHHGGGSGEAVMVIARPVVQQPPLIPAPVSHQSAPVSVVPQPVAMVSEKVSGEVSRVMGTIGSGEDIRAKRNLPGVIPDARAIAGGPKKQVESSESKNFVELEGSTKYTLSPGDFARLLVLDVRRKQKRATSGSKGSINMGGN